MLVLAATVLVAGAIVLGVAFRAQVSSPRVVDRGRIAAGPATHPPSPGARDARSTSAASRPTTPPPLGSSPPVRVRIPTLGIDAAVHPIGLNPDGTLGVPQPGPHLDDAAWYVNSPSPGQPGPSVIEGHVDTTVGPSVFFRLGDIAPGALVEVERRDGVRVTFRVDAVRDFLKTRFPSHLVYVGPRSQVGVPTLRLITCSDYDPALHHHVGNEVVFGHLVHVAR